MQAWCSRPDRPPRCSIPSLPASVRKDSRPASSMATIRSGAGGPALVWCRFTPDRSRIHPQTELKSFTGLLQADATDHRPSGTDCQAIRLRTASLYR